MFSGKSYIAMALLFLAGGTQAWAMPISSAGTTTWGTSNFSISPVTDQDNGFSNTGAAVAVNSTSTSSDPSLWTFSARSTAQAQPALIRLNASSYAAAYDNLPLVIFSAATAQATSTARWTDSFTFDGGALNGQMGQLVAGFRVDGAFTSNSDASTNLSAKLYQQYQASISLSNGNRSATEVGGQRHQVDFNGDRLMAASGVPLRSPGVWVITLDFVYGTPIHISILGDIVAEASALACNSGACNYPSSVIEAIADFSHTIHWNGILGLTDSNGNPVNNYSVNSLSGFDYRNSALAANNTVPEPSTILLVVFGFALLWLQTRRQASPPPMCASA